MASLCQLQLLPSPLLPVLSEPLASTALLAPVRASWKLPTEDSRQILASALKLARQSTGWILLEEGPRGESLWFLNGRLVRLIAPPTDGSSFTFSLDAIS